MGWAEWRSRASDLQGLETGRLLLKRENNPPRECRVHRKRRQERRRMKAGLPFFPIVLFLLLHPSSVSSWKKDEFRNCNQTPFCKRARTRSPSPAASTLIASDVRILSGDLLAKISHSDRPSNPLILRLSAYQGGVLRLAVDEDPSLDPPKKRFQPPDVVLPDFDASKLWLQRLSPSSDANSSVVYLSPDHEAVLRHQPFEVYVRAAIARGGPERRLISLNHNGLFDFEQLREKRRRRKKDEEGNELEEEEDDEDWEERFRSHTDSRPYGPQSITFDVSFHGADFVYGIPEHASTSLALKPTRGPGVDFSEPYRLFNLDVFEYDHESPFGIYGSIPFMLAHGKSSGTAGFFWLNAAEMQIDVLAPGWAATDEKRIDTLWMSEAGIVDAFFFLGPGPKDVVEQYTGVTGRPSLPQLFATAYHQCRWNYRDEEDVAEVDAKFDEFDIPYDVLWLDIEHTDGKRYFTWDKALFPHPEEMQRNLAAKGRKMVTIVDPHIKRDDDFHLHKEATQKGYYVKDAKGNDFDGWCWPGSSSYPDMLNPEIREWWADKFSFQSYVGSTPTLYIWNDMNEPSVFNGPEVSLPCISLRFCSDCVY